MEAAPEFFQTGYYEAECFSPERRLSDAQNGDQFVIEDLFDFPNDDTATAVDAGLEAAVTGNSADSSPVTAADASFSLVVNATEPHLPANDNGGPRSSVAGQFAAGELCVPYDDLAGLEWVSKFVDESFCSEDLQTNAYQFQPETVAAGSTRRPEVSVPAKARSKRSRAAPGNWTSRLQAVSPTSPIPALSSSSESDAAATAKKAVKPAVQKKKDVVQDGSTGGEGRKCLHCATDKTPQWRTGPMGPKTLCNACGVRYKSGRLVPEYRPASSPTFVMAKHSNSHRKVLELRRQKEMQKAQSQPEAAAPYLHHHHHHQNVMFDVPNCDAYLINPHMGPDYRQMI